jgi:hypothetical protein
MGKTKISLRRVEDRIGWRDFGFPKTLHVLDKEEKMYSLKNIRVTVG